MNSENRTILKTPVGSRNDPLVARSRRGPRGPGHEAMMVGGEKCGAAICQVVSKYLNILTLGSTISEAQTEYQFHKQVK